MIIELSQVSDFVEECKFNILIISYKEPEKQSYYKKSALGVCKIFRSQTIILENMLYFKFKQTALHIKDSKG